MNTVCIYIHSGRIQKGKHCLSRSITITQSFGTRLDKGSEEVNSITLVYSHQLLRPPLGWLRCVEFCLPFPGVPLTLDRCPTLQTSFWISSEKMSVFLAPEINRFSFEHTRDLTTPMHLLIHVTLLICPLHSFIPDMLKTFSFLCSAELRYTLWFINWKIKWIVYFHCFRYQPKITFLALFI